MAEIYQKNNKKCFSDLILESLARLKNIKNYSIAQVETLFPDKMHLIRILMRAHKRARSARLVGMVRALFKGELQNSFPGGMFIENPNCFISYSWDSSEHKDWVRKLGSDLIRNGIQTYLDQWDTHPAKDLPQYIESRIRSSDYVILICTPNFAKKANRGEGGVGYEKNIITGEIFSKTSEPEKFIPVLRNGDSKSSIPSYLKSKQYVGFTDDDRYEDSLEELLRYIHNIPRYERPPLGKKPTFSSDEKNIARSKVYCSRCGASVGEKSECTGLYVHHDFTSGSGTIYCTRCGALAGVQSQCTGLYVHHDFTSGSGTIYCTRCGALAGVQSHCIGLYVHHDFIEK